MAEQRKEIKFNKSMIGYKRNENFAYLSKGLADVFSEGLYPARDYTEFTTMPTISSGVITGLWGMPSTNGQTKPYFNLYWLHDKGSGAYDWYHFGQTTPISSVSGINITGVVEVKQEVYYTDGFKIRRARTAPTTTFGTYTGANSPTACGFDGLYAWFVEENADIWRWLPSGTVVEKIFANHGLNYILKIDFYKDQMAIFTNSTGSSDFDGNNYVYLWDKENSSFFEKRIPVKGYILGGGVINEELYVIYSQAQTLNPKEQVGNIVFARYNGENFVEINSIKAGGRFVDKFLDSITYNYLSGNICTVSDNFILVSLRNNQNSKDELYRNYIYKFYTDGTIKIETGPVNESNINHAPAFIKSFRTFNSYIYNNKIYTNEETDETNTEYTNYTKTTYITNFLCNPYNQHRLSALSITFEKLFNAEELDIYYRTSDKEAFTLLANITRQKVIDYVNKRIDQTGVVPTPSQRYQITKMPDNNALPEFNEIQFKFVSKKGFSIIGSWFEYDYITRVTKK